MTGPKQSPEYNEDEVLAQAAQGDGDAFGALYERYVGRIYNYIFYRTGSASDAEDLTARVFFRAHKHIPRFRNMGVPFSAWLYRIAHNLVANWHRDNSRRREVPLEDNLPLYHRGEQPEVMLINNQEVENLLRRIRHLPPERQQLIILKFVERFSNAEVGMIMGKSEGAVKSLYHRTLMSLRDDLTNGQE